MMYYVEDRLLVRLRKPFLFSGREHTMSCPFRYREKEYLLVFPLNQSIVRTVTGCDHQVKQTGRGIYRPEKSRYL